MPPAWFYVVFSMGRDIINVNLATLWIQQNTTDSYVHSLDISTYETVGFLLRHRTTATAPSTSNARPTRQAMIDTSSRELSERRSRSHNGLFIDTIHGRLVLVVTVLSEAPGNKCTLLLQRSFEHVHERLCIPCGKMV